MSSQVTDDLRPVLVAVGKSSEGTSSVQGTLTPLLPCTSYVLLLPSWSLSAHGRDQSRRPVARTPPQKSLPDLRTGCSPTVPFSEEAVSSERPK